MPYKFDTEKKKISSENDKRVKLSEQQRKEIKELYGKISQRKLAKMYGVSRRLIVFIGCPAQYTKNLQARIKKGGSKHYYDKEKHRVAMKKYRHNKKALNEKKLLEDDDEMAKFKQKCPMCDNYFENENTNRKYCFECSPSQKKRV